MNVPSEVGEALGNPGGGSEFRPSSFSKTMEIAPIRSQLAVNRIDTSGHMIQQQVAHAISLLMDGRA